MRSIRIVAAVLFAAAVAATGCTAHSTVHPAAAPPPASSTPPITSDPTPNPPAAPTTTLPLGHIERLDAVQAIGEGTAVAVGKGVILATSNGGRRWIRIWRGPQELRDLDFVSARTGWAVGDGILLGTVDGGQHWRRLGQPQVGPLRQVTSSAPPRAGAVAGGADRANQRSVPATRLVQTSDGGRTWTALAAPAPPQSVCFTAPDDGRLASDRTCGTRSTVAAAGARGQASPCRSPPTNPPFFAALQCARPGAAWVRFDSNDHYAGHSPYALYTSGDGGAHWHGVLSTLGAVLPVRLPDGPGSYPGPFSVIDPQRAFLLSPTPAAEATGAVVTSQGGSQLRRLPDLPGITLFMPHSVSFASASRGWAVGADLAGRAVLLATSDGGRSWHSQLPS
jgi:photosystem II stability/assembly factor-like uncharacterized protein